MIVTIQNGGNSYYRFYVSKSDVNKFDPSWRSILLKLEDENYYHEVSLTNCFWTGCSELRSVHINSWIKRCGLTNWEKHQTHKLNLIAKGDKKFIISSN